MTANTIVQLKIKVTGKNMLFQVLEPLVQMYSSSKTIVCILGFISFHSNSVSLLRDLIYRSHF
jgi:hypothetical protein